MTHEVDPFDNTEVAGILGTSLPPVEPPAHLRAQILEAITRTPQAHEQAQVQAQEPAQPAAQTIAQVDEAMLRAEQFATHIPEPTITAESAMDVANAHVHTLPGRSAPSRSAAETSRFPAALLLHGRRRKPRHVPLTRATRRCCPCNALPRPVASWGDCSALQRPSPSWQSAWELDGGAPWIRWIRP